MKNNIRKINRFIMFCFVLLILNMIYWQVFQSDYLVSHTANPRLKIKELQIKRGSILDRNGVVLAESIEKDGKFVRQYPFGEKFAHVVGYSTKQGIRTGLENAYNGHLLGVLSDQKINNYIDKLQGKPPVGLDLRTTLDARLQTLGQELLKGKRGSIVVMQPKTGEILALISSPTFDPNRIGEHWEQLNTDENQKPLLNRGTQGLYPPGSVLKLMTGAGYLEKNQNSDQNFECPGYIQIGNYKLNDSGVHGTVDFEKALKVSCNTSFAQMGLDLGQQYFYDFALKFMFNKEINFDLGVKKSFIPQPNRVAKQELAQESIGQGEILVTPLHMALLTATIANDGQMITPFLKQGQKPKVMGKIIISEKVTVRLKAAMEKVVSEGTGTRAQISGIQVAGKTGTAENPHGESHAWFVGFAPANNPEVVVSVIVENGGGGGKNSAPLAKLIFEEALKN